MKKPYYIKYRLNLPGPFNWIWTNRYKTKSAMQNALADMKRKGHEVVEVHESENMSHKQY